MNIFLGNLKLEDVIKEECLNKIQEFLNQNGYRKETRCNKIEEEVGNYHIFDIPRQMQVCGEEKTKQFISFLRKENFIEKAFKGSLTLVSVSNNQLTNK